MPRAVNPETGEVLFLVDDQWVPPLQTAKNESGEAAYLVNNQWVLPGQDYTGAPAGTSNPFMGVVGRAAEIVGSGVEAVARVGEKAGDALETALPLSNLSPEEIKNKRQLEPMFQFADKLKNVSKDIGYSPTTKLSDIGDNPLTVIPFVAERIISSSPDMAAAVLASPAYITSLTNEILNDRLANDNKTLADATVKDVSLSLAAAFAQGKFEKYATKHLISGKAVGATAARRIGKETALQFGTEGVEEGIDYLGRTVDTEKGVDTKELLASMAEGAITGGGVGITGQGARELLTRNRTREADTEKKVIDTLAKEEANLTPPAGVPLSETQAYDQMIREAETGVAMQPLQPIAPIPAQPVTAPIEAAATPIPTAPEMAQPVVAPTPEIDTKALQQNNFAFIGKDGQIKSVYGDIAKNAQGRDVIKYKNENGKDAERLLTPDVVVNPTPDDAELLDLYKVRNKLDKEKDNFKEWLFKKKINPRDISDLGMEKRTFPLSYLDKNAVGLDVLALDALDSQILTESDLEGYANHEEAMRDIIRSTLEGEAEAPTLFNIKRAEAKNAVESQIEAIENAKKGAPEEAVAPEFVEPEPAIPAEAVTPGEYVYREPVTPSTNLSEEGKPMFEVQTPFSDKFAQEGRELARNVRASLNKMGLGDVGLRFEDQMVRHINGQPTEITGEYLNQIITISLSSSDPIRTLNHEALHALKELGFFSKKEWSMLESKARSEWMEKYDIANPNKYGNESPEIQIEEAIAHAFADYQTQSPEVKSIATRIKQFFAKVKNALTGKGFRTETDVFQAAAEGKLTGKQKAVAQKARAEIGDRAETEAEGPSGIQKLNKIRRNYRGEIVSPETVWSIPDDSKFERFIYKIQDKFIDTKRVVQAIKTQIKDIVDTWDAYLKEELYHGRTAKRTKDFLQNELLPLVQKMRNNNISVVEFDTFLHARHAKERNEQIAKINPEFLEDGSPNPNAMPDGGSGMFTKDAEAYMAKLDPKKKKVLEELANKVDGIVKDTQNILVKSGLESQDTIDIWNQTYQHYVPLMRKDLDFAQEFTGLGQGFQVKGGASKRAFGSFKEVADIFANIANQRERAIVRSEKARVGNALYGLAIMNPNTDFWLPVNPDAIKDPEKLVAELEKMGIDPREAKNLIQEPQVADVDPQTGTVVYKVNPILRNSPNVFSVRIGGQQRYIFFNPSNERAMRMVEAVKNLDAEEMGWALGNAAKVTRWIASVNTQYNPVFGAYNFIRDTLGAQFNLSTTPLAGQQAKVTAGVLPALRGIYKDLRSQRAGEGAATGEWAKLWEEYQQEGGATGYRDQFSKNRDEQSVIEREMANLEKGNVKKGVAAVFNWLSDYNDAMENAVRLSAYKAGIDKGLTKERAASLAKNLTVNFNRKGERAQQLGALYAFFNASVQGSARLAETLTGPAGKKIIGGGLLLGSVQAIALAMMGFKDDEPSEFIKERNLVIPFPDGHYFAIPMPLGLHVIPNIGRITTELVLGGGKDAGKKVSNLAGVFMDSFNPIGNAGLSMQSLSPTMLDPIAAIIENKDTFGRPIAREDRATNPTPGYTRTRETASYLGKELSYFLNIASGGTKYQKGMISPTPDQIDFLAGQATGGVGREISKAEQAITAAVTGEELPSYKVPLVGKFYGDVTSQAAQANRFYENITKMANYENEIKGRQKDKVSTVDFFQDHPEARLYQRANQLENEISKLNREKKALVEKGADKDRIKAIEDRKTRIMTQFNNQIENLEK